MKWHLLKGNLKRWLNNKHNWVIKYSNCITWVDSTHFKNILIFVSAYHTGWFLTPDITLGINKSAFKHTRIKRLIFDINIFRPLFGNYWNLLNFMFFWFPWVCQCHNLKITYVRQYKYFFHIYRYNKKRLILKHQISRCNQI